MTVACLAPELVGIQAQVDDDRLAVDAIADAMNGKDFFLQPHTLKHLLNGELFETQVEMSHGGTIYGLIL